MEDINYWELRKIISKIIPRTTSLYLQRKTAKIIKEKGRKKNYSQFNLKENEWRKQERLLNTEEINSFLEISLRAQACPMPFNMDIWDGLLCPFNCLYCYANAFRASLYTAFFDNSKTMGFRHCNSDYYKKEMDKMGKYRLMSFAEKQNLSGINKAFGLNIPLRMGIRFEDFLKAEKKKGVSLKMLNYLADIEYPVMINSKSTLPAQDDYIDALSRNPAKSAIHLTVISSDNEILKKIEPGAPSYDERLQAIKILIGAGIRVVPRIEPYLFLLTDKPEDVQKYMSDMWEVGVRNITYDTYSYTAFNRGIRQSIINKGYDFDRIFLAGCDSQPIGSLLLGKYMDLFRDFGFSCSTFDMGNTPTNNQDICCEVGDWFAGKGFNYGCTVMASRYIKQHAGKVITWKEWNDFVDSKGGFLTHELKIAVKELWNLQGNVAYSHKWATGLTPCGQDENGLQWRWDENTPDYRIELLQNLI